MRKKSKKLYAEGIRMGYRKLGRKIQSAKRKKNKA